MISASSSTPPPPSVGKTIGHRQGELRSRTGVGPQRSRLQGGVGWAPPLRALAELFGERGDGGVARGSGVTVARAELLDQLGTLDADGTRGVDPDTDHVTTDLEHGDGHVVPDEHTLTGLATQH